MSGIGNFIKNNIVAIITGIIAIGGAYTAVQVNRAIVGRDITELQETVKLIDSIEISEIRKELNDLDNEFNKFITILNQEINAINNDLAIDYESIQNLTRRIESLEREMNQGK
jgi:predicted RNase H-like nuclease (RuvC/YqgF family)